MRPSDIAYADAMKFVQFLQEHEFTVRSVHRSKLESFFRGVEKAALIKTDKGILEVIFFSEPTGAERIRVSEQREASRYLYSFQGQPNPQPGDGMDSNRPRYFIMHLSWFIVTNDMELYTALKKAFS
ncbi:MAG TPA: hypothetical protein VGL91_01810 [Acidobacteriota bacterium]